MDVFHEMDSVKAEKAKAMRRYRRFRQIAGVFRCVEFFVGFLLLAWLSLRLPLVLKLSGEFLRQLAAVVASPLFVFLVGNAIVITLYANSRHFSGGAGDQLYDEFVKSSEGRGAARAEAPPEVVEDKAVCEEGEASIVRKEFRRSKSEVAPADPAERMQRLRRSETDAAGRGKPPSLGGGDERRGVQPGHRAVHRQAVEVPEGGVHGRRPPRPQTTLGAIKIQSLLSIFSSYYLCTE